jgi:four helix bundle protein
MGMSVYRFEDLRVWQAAKEQCDRVGTLLKRPEFVADDGVSSQINRASVSVMFNISEGFLRRKDKETLQFLRYAFASNGEVKAGYYASQGRNYISRAELEDFIRLNESIARMLRRWQSTLVFEEKGPSTKDGPRTKKTRDGPRGPSQTKDPD